MNTAMRWTLIITQVGGGFLGVVTTLVYVLGTENLAAIGMVISMGFVALYVFVTIAGVLLALDERRLSLMRVALWMQVPVISSPILGWFFSSGFCFNLTWIGGNLGFDFWLGSRWQFYLFEQLPWGVGVNLFAVLMLFLLGRFKASQKAVLPSIAGQIDSILQSRLAATPLAERGIRLQTSPEGNVIVVVGSQTYPSVDEVPKEEVKLMVKSAIAEWETGSNHKEVPNPAGQSSVNESYSITGLGTLENRRKP